MGFDLVGFSEATPGTGTVPVAVALNETLYGVSGDELKITQKAPYLLGIQYNALTTGNNVILRQPREIDFCSVKTVLNTEFTPERGFMNLMAHPKTLKSDEKLTVYSVNASDELTLIGLMLGNGSLGKPDRVDYVIRGTCDQALTAHTWTAGTVSWDQSLPKGIYSIVGMIGGTYKAATPELALARLTIPGYPEWRPGVPLANMVGDKTINKYLNDPSWAFWSECGLKFDTNTGYPNAEFLGTVANTDHVIQLALKKTGK